MAETQLQLPRSPNDLTPKERGFYDKMMAQIPDGDVIVNAGIANIALHFRAPREFTQGEFDRVGHCLTLLRWSWEELGKQGKPHWAYILLPLG